MSQTENNIGPKRIFNREFDIDILTNTVRKSWYWTLIFIFVFVSIAYVYLRYTKPIYEATSIIQLGSIDEGKKIVDIENVSTIGDELSSNVELLKSELILKEALKRLRLNVSYFSKGDILTEEKYKATSYLILPLTLKDSAIVGKHISVSTEGNQLILEYDFSGSHQIDRIAVGKTYENEFFKILVNVKNWDILNSNLQENELYFVFNDFGQLARAYLPNLNVKVLNPEAKSIQITYRSNNPELSKNVVESVVQTFFQHDFEKKQKGSAKILSFITEQLDSISYELELSEVKIKNFKQTNKVPNPKIEAENLFTRITGLESEKVVLDLEQNLINTINDVINEAPNRLEVYNLLPGIVGSQFERALTNQVNTLHDLLLEREDAAFSRTDKNANIKIIDKKITAQVNTIRRMLGAFTLKIKAQKDGLDKKIAEIETNFLDIPEQELELSRLERIFQLNEKYYILLLEKKAQYSISKEGFTTSNLILKDVQLPTSPISPRRTLIITMAILLGFFFGFLLIFVRYILYNEINSPEELKKLLDPRIGFLGFIPSLKTKSEFSSSEVFKNPKSSISESFRTIRSNINFVSKNSGEDTLLIGVSSTIPSEGKTFVSINLSSIYSLSGKKTLIIDMDLRKPKIHLGLGLDNKKGISDVLSGNSELKEVIQSTSNGLDVISAGTIPPNPYELILNGKFQIMIEDLKKSYDVIIVDNPPIGVVSDGIEVLKLTDIPILVVRSNFSKRYFANNISSYLQDEKLTKIYTVLNGFKTRKKDYGYNYGYGKYYHEDTTNKSIFAKIFRKN